MSHSSGIGYDVQEATNGVDTSDSPETRDWMSTHGSASLKCRDGEACSEQNKQEETVPEIHTYTPHGTEPVYGQTHKNSAPHTNTNTSDDSPPHTNELLLEHTSHSQPISQNRSDMDTDDPAHIQPNDGWGGGEKDEREDDDDDDDDDVEKCEDTRETTDISVQPVKETTTEDPATSETPSTEVPNNSVSEDDAPSTASTPPEQAPPLVPAPPPSSAPAPMMPEPDVWQRPAHVMAEVRVRSAPERDRDRERVVRGMQDSKSLDGISDAYGGSSRGMGVKGGQAEGRRATISSALELEGTVSHDGDLTHFITKNLEQKIKMSSKRSLDTDSDCSGPVVRGRGSLRRPADIPPIDPSVLLDLHKHTQEVAHSVEMMLRSLNGTIQNMTALSVGYIQTYRDSVDSLGESVDMSIKGMYTLMARCEELDRSMQPIQALAAQIRDIKRTLDALEAICK
ncbi:BLOC-1-related complex subunit 6 [Colossoma macropomum]|uniref:BLOC-1-related complex subunit 6 n=1 Tax=Colossoma macropomum TaxID=42526 RepID=UPI001864362B|nr:BLOC-1-related complex subunit 6 [Colossoma macropomum]XP_036434992.1 BLOC-1-related complex subunit 6 [Colossoma macropomum]